ncbi:MAG: hypothetical protein ACTSXT_08550 [Candidatus Helarchaeota archaeon]
MFYYKNTNWLTTAFSLSIIFTSVFLGTAFLFMSVNHSPYQRYSVDNSIKTSQVYIVNTTADLNALNNIHSFGEQIEIRPTENIITTLQNFSLAPLKDFYIFGNGTYTININIVDSNFTRGFAIYGNAIVNFTNCRFAKGSGFSIYSGGSTLSIKDSLFLGKFTTDKFDSGSSIDSVNLIIDNTFFNQTVQNYGFIKIRVSSGANVQIYDTNVTNGIELIGPNQVIINNSRFGSGSISSLIDRQGIYLKNTNNINIKNSALFYDTGSIKPQGLYLDHCNNGIVKNLNISKDLNITSSSNISLSNIEITNLFYVNPSTNINVNNIPVTFNQLDIYSSDITISGISVNNIDIHGSNQEIDISNSVIIQDIDFNCVSNTGITFKKLNLRDLNANGISTNVVLNLTDSTLTNLTLLGIVETNLHNITVSNTIEVYSTSTTLIENTTYAKLIDHVNPKVQVSKNAIHRNYDIVMDTSLQVTFSWNGSDNVIDPNFNVLYKILIYKDNILILNKTISKTSYTLIASTKSNYLVKIICLDVSGNTSNTASISITFTPTLGTFFLILTIVIVSVAGAAAVIVFYLYHRAKNRWKKTPILTVSPEKK